MINIKCAKAYCKDYAKIENYKKAINDTSQVWECHHMSEESKRKNSEAHKGKKMTNENKENLSQLWKGKHWKLVDGKRVWY